MTIARQLNFIPEYALKIASIPAGVLAAGSKGSGLEKAVSGATKVWTAPFELYRKANELSYVNKLNSDYNSLTAKDFVDKYGKDGLNYVMNGLKDFIDWGNQFLQNVREQPVETGLAVAGVTGALYLAGRCFRFIRQKGQGSVLDRTERKLGDKIWRGNVQS